MVYQQLAADRSGGDAASRAGNAWPRWPLLVFFAVLFFGPIVAPLLQASALPIIADTGALARTVLSHYICPTPAKSYALLGFPMAVCARCWGATIGLWLGYVAFTRPPGRRAAFLVQCFRAQTWPVRLLGCALPFLLWWAEIARWPAAPLWFLLLNGAQAGLWAGLFFCSVWPGLPARPTSPVRAAA